MGTKNNPKNRGAKAADKTVNGKIIKPVMYMGRRIGHGNYIAGQDDGGNMITDADGKPVPFADIKSN